MRIAKRLLRCMLVCGTLLAARAAWGGATLSVSDNYDNETMNNSLSLREALKLAGSAMTRGITAGEKAKISNATFIPTGWDPTYGTLYSVAPGSGPGADFSDQINFEVSGQIDITSTLPNLYQNDHMNGSLPGGNKVILNGNSGIDGGLEIICGGLTSNHVQNLVIQNFGGEGIAAWGLQNGLFSGLVVHDNAGAGIFIAYLGSDNPRNNTIQGCDIYGNHGDGIQIKANPNADQSPSLGNVIESCHIGVATGIDMALGNWGNGICLIDAFGNTIGGDAAAAGNIISANQANGIQLEGESNANSVLNNKIGLKETGNAKMGNGQSGVALVRGAGSNPGEGRAGNAIGTAGKGNSIGGNATGITIADAATQGNTIAGNFIGTNVNGDNLGNTNYGISIENGSKNNVLDGATGRTNYICYNAAAGVRIKDAGTSGNVITGCFVGTMGTTARPNGTGIEIGGGAANNTIGSIDPAMLNVICGNTGSGIAIYDAASTGNKVIGNTIGLRSGTIALANATGIYVTADNCIIGGAGAEKNVISGNTTGIDVNGGDNNEIYGNNIGSDSTGFNKVANGTGIRLRGGAQSNIIGNDANRGNIIAGNTGHGILIQDAETRFNKVFKNSIGTALLGLGGNGGNGVRNENAFNNEVGKANLGNYIVRNDDGVYITGAQALSNVVAGNSIGISGSTMFNNRASGVVLAGGARSNIIGGDNAADRNVISGNSHSGIWISDPGTTGNRIVGNYIGTDTTGAAAKGNGWSGVSILNQASGNIIGDATTGNLISGNSDKGVDIADAGTTGNTVAHNQIGTDTAGTAALPNGGGGIRIVNGAAGNTIGGDTAAKRNTISGNTGEGIGIYNAGSNGNLIQNNYIGTTKWGDAALGNTMRGVIVQEGACGTDIRNNVISGNQTGIAINHANTTDTYVGVNMIGTNAAGSAAIGNAGHGVELNSGAKDNDIYRNTISGNGLCGVSISDGDDNTIQQNTIGMSFDNKSRIANGSHGIQITGGQNNLIGGTRFRPDSVVNIIAGNNGHGIYLSGANTQNNRLWGNLIGTNDGQSEKFPNEGSGIYLLGTGKNYIGGQGSGGSAGNVISGNKGPGITLDGATDCMVIDNDVGMTMEDPFTSKIFSLPNGGGIRICAGARRNTITALSPSGIAGRNTISGNKYYGVLIQDAQTSGNILMNNLIGYVAGHGTIPNEGNGITITSGSTANSVTYNTISGNTGHGVVLSVSTTWGNILSLNKIGTGTTGAGSLGNGGHGVLISSGAHDNQLGTSTSETNIIANNTLAGVALIGAGDANTIRCNSIHANGGLGIDLGGDGVTPNDVNDPDNGPNLLMNFPVLSGIDPSGAALIVKGRITTNPGTLRPFIVDFYANDAGDPSGHGEGQAWIGSTVVNAAAPANFTASLPIANKVKVITATVTMGGSTSEFSGPPPARANTWSLYR